MPVLLEILIYTPLVYSPQQVDALCSDFSNAFSPFPQELLLRKPNDCGLSGGYKNRFRSHNDQEYISCPLL